MRLGRRGALVLTTLAAAILVTTGDAAVTDAMLTAELHGAKLRAPAKAIRDLKEVNWETTLLPPVPPPATGRCLSEVSWEDHCLPPVGAAAVQGRLSELAWEDHLLPTLVPAKLQHIEFSEDDWRAGGG